MTDQDRIADLERRMAEQEIRLAARVDAVIETMSASLAVSVDALAVIALRDRDLVDNLLKIRRLSHQQNADKHSAEVLKRYELALQMAEGLASARPLRPH